MGSRRFLIYETEITTGNSKDLPGVIIRSSDYGIEVGTGDGRVMILKLQPEGKQKMDAKSFLAGNKLAAGDKFHNDICELNIEASDVTQCFEFL